MARGRMVSRSVFGSRKMRQVDAPAFALYVAILTHTDAEGCVEADEDSLADVLMSAGRRWVPDIAVALEQLVAAGLVELAGDGAARVARIVGFEDHNLTRRDREGASALAHLFTTTQAETPGVCRESAGSTPGVLPESAGSLPGVRREYAATSEGKGREVQVNINRREGKGDPPDPMIEAARIRAACRKANGVFGLPSNQELTDAARLERSNHFDDDELPAEIARVWKIKAARRGGEHPKWSWVLEDVGAVLKDAKGKRSVPIGWKGETLAEEPGRRRKGNVGFGSNPDGSAYHPHG